MARQHELCRDVADWAEEGAKEAMNDDAPGTPRALASEPSEHYIYANDICDCVLDQYCPCIIYTHK